MALEGRHDFGPNDGTMTAAFGIVVAVGVVIAVLRDGLHGLDAAVIGACAFAVALIWCFVLRPRLVVDGPTLILRNAFSDVRIPLVRVQRVSVTMFTNVTTDERSFRSTALTRSRAEVTHPNRIKADPRSNLPDVAEARINQLADDARAQRLPGGEITVTPAVPELILLASLAVASVVLALLLG